VTSALARRTDIDEPVLNIDPPGIGSREITHQFLVGRRILKWIGLNHGQKLFRFWSEAAGG
jgi:hypothetical protein